MKRLAALLMGIGMTLLSLVTVGGAPAHATTPGHNGRSSSLRTWDWASSST